MQNSSFPNSRSVMIPRKKTITTSQILDRLNHMAKEIAPAVQVKKTKLFGNSLFAIRDISIGEVVTDESACLVLNGGDYIQGFVDLVQNRPEDAVLFDYFMSLSPEEAEKIPKVAELINSVLFRVRALLDKSFVAEFVSAFELNAFAVNGGGIGLFMLASKAPHSCSPNVIYKNYDKDKLKKINCH